MPTMQCLVCGKLSNQSRCKKHRTRQARGYTDDIYRKVAEAPSLRDQIISGHPVCDGCGHTAIHWGHKCPNPNCKKCPLVLDHRVPLARIRITNQQREFQVLCQECNRRKSDDYKYPV